MPHSPSAALPPGASRISPLPQIVSPRSATSTKSDLGFPPFVPDRAACGSTGGGSNGPKGAAAYGSTGSGSSGPKGANCWKIDVDLGGGGYSGTPKAESSASGGDAEPLGALRSAPAPAIGSRHPHSLSGDVAAQGWGAIHTCDLLPFPKMLHGDTGRGSLSACGPALGGGAAERDPGTPSSSSSSWRAPLAPDGPRPPVTRRRSQTHSKRLGEPSRLGMVGGGMETGQLRTIGTLPHANSDLKDTNMQNLHRAAVVYSTGDLLTTADVDSWKDLLHSWKDGIRDAVLESGLVGWRLVWAESAHRDIDDLHLDGCPGIVLVGDVRSLRELPSLLERMLKDRRQMQAIVLVVGDDKKPEMLGKVTGGQAACFAAGADDVVFGAKHGGVEALTLALAMGSRRCARRREEQGLWQKKCQVLMREDAEKQRGTDTETDPSDALQHNKMFWSCVHRVFEAFPMVEADCANEVLDEGNRVGKCILGAKLGEGAFGSVFASSHHDTGIKLAVKVLKKTRIQDLVHVRSIWREFTLLQKLRHTGIVRLFGVIHTRHHICIVMEDAGKATLWDAIDAHGKLEEIDIWDVCGQVAEALKYIHGIGIAHRDVKHDNIVLSEDDSRPRRSAARLVDFGLALEVSKARLENICGTMPFAAPEVLKAIGQGGTSTLDLKATDIWAFGVVVLDATCGLLQINRLLGWPVDLREGSHRGLELESFFARDRDVVLGAILDCETGDGEPFEMSQDLQEALLGCFNVLPDCRWDIAEIVDAFAKKNAGYLSD
mmetsp:Transcript_134366/g.429104  ORF Transcript_134366/g.429104 Transcript_134366/m.429104 type:complete len:773 (-) Transcript_134366:237-2555(-)